MSTKKQLRQKRQKSNTQLSSESEEEQNEEQGIASMFSNILAEIRDLKKQNENFMKETKKDIQDLKEEIKGLDMRMENKTNKLENKVTNLDNNTDERFKDFETKLKTLEEKEERRLRRERRNNIIIKSKDLTTDNRDELNTKVMNILRKLDYKDSCPKTTYIGKDYMERGMAKVELKSLRDKIEIMRNKSKLKDSDIYIDDDMTKQEREIQAKLRRIAKEERDKGNTVKVGYQKLLINEQWVNWSALSQPQIT